MNYLFPVRIIDEKKAQNTETLLREKTLQIGLAEQDLCLISPGGYVILDYGREVCGGVRILTFLAEGDVKIRLRFGESLSEACSQIGEKNSTNDHAVRDLVTYLPSYSDQTFGQTGFRFVRIDVLSKSAALPLKTASAAVSIIEREVMGSFACDDPKINRIWETAAYTVRLCMQNGYFWDGIKRDRLVWIGDIYPEMRAAHCLFPEVPEVSASLQFARMQTPLPEWINGYATYSLWWLIILSDEVNRFAGSITKEDLDYAEGILRLLEDVVQEDGTVRYRDGFVFIDWPSLPLPGEPEWKKEDWENGVHALMEICLDKAKDLPGLSQDTRKLCETLLNRLHRKERTVRQLKQIAGLCALAGDRSEQHRNLLLKDGARGLSTFMSYVILTAMAQYGDAAQAIRVMKEYYGGMLDAGATTFWEDFNLEWMIDSSRIDALPKEGESDIHGDNGAFCYTGFRHSLCHGWSAGVLAFLAETVAGIREVGTEGKAYSVRPALGDLNELKITYPTKRGPLKVCCLRTPEGTVKVAYTAPEGVEVLT